MAGEGYNITREQNHYRVDIDGEFYCTADTALEAANEIDKYVAKHEQTARLDWSSAIKNVKEVKYNNYTPRYCDMCDRLLREYDKGERTQELYDRMINLC